jgi:CDP-diacylglycerol--glycerol-3-phosphate 3-phosphatidyltransferase
MPTIYDFKPRFQALLRPLCGRLAGSGITANQVTVAALVLSAAGGGLVLLGTRFPFLLLAVPLILFLRMALNAMDGMLAREYGMQSAQGVILNELGDVLADCFLYLPFALLPGVASHWIIILVLVGVMVEMTGVVAVMIGASRRYDGPFGKSDRAFLFGVIGLLAGLGLQPGRWVDGLMILAIILSCLTVYKRARGALAEAA